MSDSRGTDDDVTDFLQQFRRLLQRVNELPGDEEDGERLADVLGEYLGVDLGALAIVSEHVPVHRVVDADLALDEVAGRDPEARVIGIGGDVRHHVTFGDLLQRQVHGMTPRLGQVDYSSLATGPRPEDKRQVIASGVRLFAYEGRRVAVRQQGPNPQYGREDGVLEVLAPDRETADELVGLVRRLMDERSVLSGQVITFGADPYGRGMAGITFVERPTLTRADVVLPGDELDRVAQHVLGIGAQRERLREHGQHLKRGVLLYGPPGTGKTHTVRYLLAASPGTTAVLLSGGALSAIHAAAKVARAHQPAIVVLEDCDLVAGDRSMGPGTSPLLFEVLDALDGLDADADVAFLLTTNRVEDLEVALSQRPGRVDLAVEIPLPDEAGRLSLLHLYGRGLFGEEAMTVAAQRSAGTTASFAKELVRRAVLAAAVAGDDVGDTHLSAALDVLLSDAEQLTRNLLGVGGSDAELPDGVGPGPLHSRPLVQRGGGVGGGWFAYSPNSGHRHPD